MVEDLVQGSYNQIVAQLGSLNTLTNSLLSRFEGYANDLADLPLPALTPPPVYADPGAGSDVTPTFGSPPAEPSTPNISDFDVTEPNERDIDSAIAGIDPTMPDFDPSIASISFPTTIPSVGSYPVPDKPAVSDITLPSEPSFAEPGLDALHAITLPAFTPIILPTFDTAAPTLDASAPSSVLAWSEPEYSSEELDLVKAKIVEMMNGKSGLPADVEQALFDRARGREDTLAVKAVNEAFETFASRGYSMPPGMLAAQVNATVEDSQLKGQSLSRDVYIKAQETLIQQLNQAVQQCVAIENMQINLFNNVAQRRLEIEKARIDQAIAIYNAEVQAFNIRSQAYGVQATVFKVKVDAEISKLEAYKAQIESQKAIGQLNQQLVEVYKARLQALATSADVYKTRVQAATAKIDADKLKIDMFKSEIDAYIAQLQGDKTRVDAYRSQVEAEAAKVGVINAEANVYMAKLRAKETFASVSLRKVDALINAAQNDTTRFAALIEAEKAKVTSTSSIFATKSDNYRAQLQKFVAEAQTGTAYAELNVKRVEGAIRNSVALYQAEIAKYAAEAERVIKLGNLNAESLRMMAQYSAQLAAGAMSAVHLAMSFSGSAGVGINYNIQQ